MGSVFGELRVVTSARWLADDLAVGSPVPVVSDLGLDVPANTDNVAWWCSGTYAARLAKTGVRTSFHGPTGPWLSTFDPDALGRTVRALSIAELRAGTVDVPRAGFCKLADIKLGSLPAAWWPDVNDFTARVAQLNLPGSTPLLISDTRLDLTHEVRCFILDGHVVTASTYLFNEHTWDAFDADTVPPPGAGAAFAEAVLRDVDEAPAGWVLDVAQCREGRWVVLEANPAWSSNPYHCTADGAVATILAGQDPADDPRWAWMPGEYLTTRVRPLPVRAPQPRAASTGA